VATALVYSVGLALDSDGQHRFSAFLQDLAAAAHKTIPAFETVPWHTSDVFAMGYVDGAWTPWEKLISPVTDFNMSAIHTLLIPTVDTVRFTYILDALV
jgi:hypothetical protein